jgi:hypothetical protein
VNWTRETVRLGVIAFALLGLAAATYGTLRLTFGVRPVYVHVRWAAPADTAVRQQREQRYKLTQGEFREERTWGYALIDLSRDNIQALVNDPAVEDTHQIHRTAYRVGYFAPRLPYPTSRPWIPVTLEVISASLLGLAFVALCLALLDHFAPGISRGPAAGLRRAFLTPRAVASPLGSGFLLWLRSRIPPASAEAVALFRIVFGVGLLVFVLMRPVGDSWAGGQTNEISSLHQLVLRIFRDAPWLALGIAPWLALWGVLFVAGAFARLSFAMTTVGVFAWASLYTTRLTYHTVSALLTTLVCLLWSKWGDAWSVDAWWNRRPAHRATPLEYGFTVWVPGLVLGLLFLAAAFAKLRGAGIAWILNGTVKYHFLSDSGQAMVDWGLRLGHHAFAAVVFSFAAVAIETGVVVGVLSRRYVHRLIAGGAALLLLIGFVLLQGLRWYGWWLLLVSFLPWHLVKPPRPAEQDVRGAGAGRPVSWRLLLRPAAVSIVLALLVLQTVTSLFGLEMSPLISSYDMYSTTYGSPAEYERKAADAFWVLGTDTAGQSYECRVTRDDADLLAGKAPTAARGAREVLQQCFAGVRLRTVSIETRRVRVDWNAWRLERPARITLGSVTPPS